MKDGGLVTLPLKKVTLNVLQYISPPSRNTGSFSLKLPIYVKAYLQQHNHANDLI